MNGRTALGAALVVLAVLAGALFLDRSQRLVPVYAAARDLPAGTSLHDGDLVVIRVRLPASALRHYLRPSASRRVTGGILTAPVRRETLVPAGFVLTSSREADLVELPVQVDPGDMARGLRPGDSVQVLAAYTEGTRRGRGGRPAADRRGGAGPPGLGWAHRLRAGTGRPAPHADRPCADRGRRHRHRPDLRGQGPRTGCGGALLRIAAGWNAAAPDRPFGPRPLGARDLDPRSRGAGCLRAGCLRAGRLRAGRFAARRLAPRWPTGADLAVPLRRHPADRYPAARQVGSMTGAVRT
jgi:hypothetical protein